MQWFDILIMRYISTDLDEGIEPAVVFRMIAKLNSTERNRTKRKKQIESELIGNDVDAFVNMTLVNLKRSIKSTKE